MNRISHTLKKKLFNAIYHFFFLKPTSNPNFFTDLYTFIIPEAKPSTKKIIKNNGEVSKYLSITMPITSPTTIDANNSKPDLR